MKTILAITLLLAACSGCQPDRKPVDQPWGLEYVSGSISQHPDLRVPYQFTVRVRIGGTGHAVQELRSGNASLVEVFTPNCIDLHIGSCGESRTMSIYQATVSGVALNANGYGVQDASPLAGNPFNSANLPVGGAIISRGPALQWSLIADASGVTVTLPNRVVFIPAP